MDPADLTELWRAWRIRERRRSLRFARIAAVVANANRGKGVPPFSASDFCEIAEEETDE
jgi:hypothetical protein